MSDALSAEAAEREVQALLLRAGWQLWRPVPQTGVDMMAEDKLGQVRIQVKSCERVQKNGSYRFDLRKKSSNGLRQRRDWNQEVDLIVCVAPDRHVFVLTPEEHKKSAVALRPRDASRGHWLLTKRQKR